MFACGNPSININTKNINRLRVFLQTASGPVRPVAAGDVLVDIATFRDVRIMSAVEILHGGRQQYLPAPVERTEAGSRVCRPRWSVRRPVAGFAGPGGAYGGR